MIVGKIPLCIATAALLAVAVGPVAAETVSDSVRYSIQNSGWQTFDLNEAIEDSYPVGATWYFPSLAADKSLWGSYTVWTEFDGTGTLVDSDVIGVVRLLSTSGQPQYYFGFASSDSAPNQVPVFFIDDSNSTPNITIVPEPTGYVDFTKYLDPELQRLGYKVEFLSAVPTPAAAPAALAFGGLALVARRIISAFRKRR